MELKQDFTCREDAAAYLADALSGLYDDAPIYPPSPAPLVGGQTEGMRRLRVFNVGEYQATRNDVGNKAGASLLAPYIRHGCITLEDAKQDAFAKIGRGPAYKWVQELAWREFWQLQWGRYGNGIFEPMETAKVPLGDDDTLPDDIRAASTGLNCMDISLTSLYRTGYMFNHARLWFAAYYVHHRKLTWQSGAQLFYQQLLCGDPASNWLSWQWVASTFSHKPYIFDRRNVEKYSRASDGTTYCTNCPAAKTNTCPFDFSYDELGRRLFGKGYESDDHSRPRTAPGAKRDKNSGVGSRRPSWTE